MNGDPGTLAGQCRWHLQVLGPFRLTRVEDDTDPAATESVLLPTGSARLLTYLAVTGPASRLQVSGTLWPDLPQHRASADLRTALWRVQRVGGPLVRSSRDHLQLGAVDVDLHRVERWVNSVVHHPHTHPGPAPHPPDGVCGELAPQWDDEWLEQPRERMRLLQLQALETVTDRLLVSGRIGEALSYAITLVHAAPLRESSNQLMLEIHLRQGNVAEALRHFERYQRLLDAELGVTPGPSITTLMARFLPVPVHAGPRP